MRPSMMKDKVGQMRFYTAPILSSMLAALSVVTAHAQAYGATSNDVANQAGGPGSYRTAPNAFGASSLNVMHPPRCALGPGQTRSAEKLANLLVEDARFTWEATNRQPPADREMEIERALVRTLERVGECSIVAHRAVSLARDAFSQKDPSHQALDLTLTTMDVLDRSQPCDCKSARGSGPAFGGPPLGNSGGGGGGVTHPLVASPQ
jgi:hypothetical protein